MAVYSRTKRQRKSQVDTQAPIYHDQSKLIDVTLSSWVYLGFNATLTQIKVTLNYCNNDGTKQLNAGDIRTEAWAIKIINHSVPKFRSKTRIVAVEQVRTFEEFWCEEIPGGYVPLNILPLDTPIITVALNPIDIYENEPVYLEWWENKFKAMSESMEQRNKQQYLDFLNREIAKVSASP